MSLAVGRIVNFVMANGEIRPAIIVRVWSETCVNLRVFLDGWNDTKTDSAGNSAITYYLDNEKYNVCDEDGWVTSASLDESHRPRTFHF